MCARHDARYNARFTRRSTGSVTDGLLDRGDTDDAVRAFGHAIEAEFRFAQGYVNLAAAYGKKGMYAEALEAFEQAATIDPAFRERMEEIRQGMRDDDQRSGQ